MTWPWSETSTTTRSWARLSRSRTATMVSSLHTTVPGSLRSGALLSLGREFQPGAVTGQRLGEFGGRCGTHAVHDQEQHPTAPVQNRLDHPVEHVLDPDQRTGLGLRRGPGRKQLGELPVVAGAAGVDGAVELLVRLGDLRIGVTGEHVEPGPVYPAVHSYLALQRV